MMKLLSTHARARLAPGLAAVALLSCLVSCGDRRPVRYLHPERPIDTEWGYPESQARIEVSGRVAFTASTGLLKEEGVLSTVVTLTNVSDQQIRLTLRGCPVQLQVFREEARTGEPAWDSFGGQKHECPVRQVLRRLDAFEDLHLPLLTRPELVLRDSLPSGRYYFTAIVRPNGIRVDVPAGDVQLTREREDS